MQRHAIGRVDSVWDFALHLGNRGDTLMFCIDTSALSAANPRLRSSDQVAVAWLKANSSLVHIPSVVLAELERGIAKLELTDDCAKAGELRSWVGVIHAEFAGRIQPVDADVATLAGQLRARAEFRSARVSLVDSLVAALAQSRGWHVLTANAKDFRALGASILAISQSGARDRRQLILPFEGTAAWPSAQSERSHLAQKLLIAPVRLIV